MKRLSIKPRENFKDIIESQGFIYNMDGYYTETAAYQFTEQEILNIERATIKLQEMSLEVVQHVIDKNLWDEMKIPKEYADLIKYSWKEDMCSFYGRMDLGYNNGQIKLLEYNADTPTSILEAAVIQWFWLKDYEKLNSNIVYDQFNSIHEKLIEHMKICKPYFLGDKVLTFACIEDGYEDFMNVKYMQDVAEQAGIRNEFLYLHEIGVSKNEKFVREDGSQLKNIFKLYPYECMFEDEFGKYLEPNKEECYWIEPAWKSIISNKMFCKFLYDLFPKSEYVLPCSYGKPITENYVKKPIFSREGANVEIFVGGNSIAKTEGSYGQEGYIYQDYFRIPDINGNYPIIGSWLIGGEAAGMGIRESSTLITDNMSRFCPHFFTK